MEWLTIWYDDFGTELCLAEIENTLQSYPKPDEITNSRSREKAVVQRILSEKFNESTLLKDEFGKPYLNPPTIHMNYSHSPTHFFWGSHPVRRIGVDVEQERPQLLKIARKFCHDTELKHANNGTDLLKLLLIWSSKESIFKAYGKGEIDFKEQMRIDFDNWEQEERITGYLFKDQTYKFDICYRYFEGGICTWTLWPDIEQNGGLI